MAFLRSVATTTTAIAATAASAIPIAFALSSPSSSSSSRSVRFCRAQNLPFLSSTPALFPNHLGLVRSFAKQYSAVQMADPTSEPSSQVRLNSTNPSLFLRHFFFWYISLLGTIEF